MEACGHGDWARGERRQARGVDFRFEAHANIFFKLMGERYSRRVSAIVTTNLMIAALPDRLRHRCTTIDITSPSLRRADG